SFCACEPGFEGDGFTCENVDECARRGDGVCRIGTCVDLEGDFECDCLAGYGGIPCADIDECCDQPDICGVGTCTNEDPGYACACPFGWEFDGTTCIDIDECATGDFTCPDDRRCQNEPGTYRCGCPAGFTG